ncbi:aminoglycoside phosphotransferase family protein [Streptacidiphilus sp. EB103A]|uniref:aminoglycoside phosphotransferase family protein n=1 Tax=Streptacidiphilus sp. EB103A TaxID=3156275 RepID=UPI0035154F29
MNQLAQGNRAVLEEACSAVGMNAAGAEVLRLAENQTWRLPQGIIMRIAQRGQQFAAAREIHVARWLAGSGIAVVQPLAVEQPVNVRGVPVSFWEELPPHSHGTVEDIALTLRKLHSLPPPTGFDLGRLDPFVRLAERIQAISVLTPDDHGWLVGLHRDLAQQWSARRPTGMADCAVHGDAWPGNIVRAGGRVVLMDLERFSLGLREWDLVSTAVRARTTGAVRPDEYDQFCALYGFDVTKWDGYALLAGARELRMVTYAALHATTHPDWLGQAQYRVDCLRGRRGPRPWSWMATAAT